MVKLSNRLLSVASFVTEGNVLADVGTDHGYIPIYLMQEGRIERAIAMDINAGRRPRPGQLRLPSVPGQSGQGRRSPAAAAPAPCKVKPLAPVCCGSL